MSERTRCGKLLGWLVEPHPRIKSGDDRPGARLFGILMLVHILAVAILLPVVNFIWMQETGISIWHGDDAKILIAGVILILACFLLLRFGNYRAGVLCYILIAIVVALLAPFAPDPNAEIGLLATGIIPVLLSAMVFSYRWVLAVLLTTLGVGTIQLLISGMPPRQKCTGFALLIVVAVTGSLILVFRYHLGVLEKHRIEQIHEGEETIRKSAEQYRQLFETVTDGIIIANLQGGILEGNGAACRQLDYTRQELLSLSINRISARSRGDIKDTLKTVIENGHAFYQTSHIRKDGSTLPVELSVAAIEFNGERAFLGVVRDLTERRRVEEEKQRLEAQLQQAVKMESIGVLAGGVAHDFNNALTTILGNAELALMDLPEDAPLAGMLREIQRAGLSAASLTRQLLAFSRKQILAPRAVDLNELITQMHKMLTSLLGEDVMLKTILARDLAPLKADPGLVEQIIVNLAANARDAMPDGGTLAIETANATLDHDYHQLHPEAEPGEYVALMVADTGTGIPPEVKERIFEPFFTTKPKGLGTGLGLATTYGAVKQSGGHIQVYSEKGSGTTFRIFLPRAPLQAEVAARPEEPMLRGNETILLVEDDKEVRNLADRILCQLGYRVLTAGGAEEALLLAGRHQEPIQLLVSDVVMPGLNGRQLSEQLTQSHPEAKVLYTSGYTENAIVHRGVLDNGVAFLAKPYTARILGAKVREVLDLPPV